MMESISSEKIPLIQHTLDKLYLAIEKLQERTASIHTVDDFLTTPGGMEKGIRDVIAHHYFEVDADVIFEIVSNELTPLKDAVAFFKKELL